MLDWFGQRTAGEVVALATLLWVVIDLLLSIVGRLSGYDPYGWWGRM